MGHFFDKSKILKLEEVDSTNLYANKLVAATPEGSVVWADFQTNGRGLGKNYWESDRGKNLTFSVILHPTFLNAVQQFYLSKIVSLAVADLLSLYATNVSIKWPNDIYIGDKKAVGILIENSIEGNFIKDSIIGIGMNINQDVFLSDAPHPVSLKQVTGDIYDTEEILKIFLSILEFRYGMLHDADYETIDENYFDILFRKGILSSFIADQNTFEGTITGVEDTGELIITDLDGTTRKFLHKEVEYVF